MKRTSKEEEGKFQLFFFSRGPVAAMSNNHARKTRVAVGGLGKGEKRIKGGQIVARWNGGGWQRWKWKRRRRVRRKM
jgi:hypothetical protein